VNDLQHRAALVGPVGTVGDLLDHGDGRQIASGDVGGRAAQAVEAVRQHADLHAGPGDAEGGAAEIGAYRVSALTRDRAHAPGRGRRPREPQRGDAVEGRDRRERQLTGDDPPERGRVPHAQRRQLRLQGEGVAVGHRVHDDAVVDHAHQRVARGEGPVAQAGLMGDVLLVQRGQRRMDLGGVRAGPDGGRHEQGQRGGDARERGGSQDRHARPEAARAHQPILRPRAREQPIQVGVPGSPRRPIGIGIDPRYSQR
jgi:hypothetical protein